MWRPRRTWSGGCASCCDALAQVDTQCVPLRDEIELLRLYLEIQQTRFGERLAVEWEVEPGMLDAEVPHLVLQPLVENAIKHAIAPRSTRGRMRIVARAKDELLHLEVHDDGPGLRPASRPGATGGIGLANTRARFQLTGEHRLRAALIGGRRRRRRRLHRRGCSVHPPRPAPEESSHAEHHSHPDRR